MFYGPMVTACDWNTPYLVENEPHVFVRYQRLPKTYQERTALKVELSILPTTKATVSLEPLGCPGSPPQETSEKPSEGDSLRGAEAAAFFQLTSSFTKTVRRTEFVF